MSIYDYTVRARKGATLNLADLKGKVLLIVNTATGCGFTPQYEALEKLYEKYHDQGLEIFQVAIDTSKALWINTIQEQQLPWISVSDLKGELSPVVGAYNVRSLPSNYLIDRTGNIAGKDLMGEKLEEAIKKNI